jgi:toxin ParE1/3/4
MVNYRLSNTAKDDLRRIYFYGLENWGEAAADEYYHALFSRFQEIADKPKQYPKIQTIREGYRRSVCGVDSIYYRISGDIVEIMTIIGRQDFN